MSPVGSPGKVCSVWEGSLAGAGKKSEEEGVAGMKCYGLIASPIPPPFCSAQQWEEMGELVIKLSQEKRKKERWGEDGFILVFVSRYLSFIGNKIYLS